MNKIEDSVPTHIAHGNTALIYLIQNRLTKPHLNWKICLTVDFFKSNVLFLYLSPMQMSMNEKKMYKL